MADGDIMWVGTSGGVIRYDIKTDDYELFDLRSELHEVDVRRDGAARARVTASAAPQGPAALPAR